MRYLETFKLNFIGEINVEKDFKFTLLDDSRYFGIDKENHIIFAVESFEVDKEPYIIRTKKLDFEINAHLTINIDGVQRDIRAYLIRCNGEENREKYVFLDLCETLFGTEQISEEYFLEMVKILSDFFSKKIEVSDKELQGLYAELFTIEFFSNDINLGVYWQRGDREKFDFSINDKLKLEVKSTIQTERRHHFKHDQLTSELFEIYVISYMLRNDDAGYSLHDLIIKCLGIVEGNYPQTLKLKKILHDNDETRLKSVRFNSEYSKDKMRVYGANVIPRFQEKDHEGVINAEYDSILEGIESLDFESFISIIQNQKG